MENKQEICDLLLKTLQATRGASDLVSLEYKPVAEVVVATFACGAVRNCNVAMDSGWVIILDVVKQLDL